MKILSLTSAALTLGLLTATPLAAHQPEHYCQQANRGELKKQAVYGQMTLCMSKEQIIKSGRTRDFDIHYSIIDGKLQQVISFPDYTHGQTYQYVLIQHGYAVNFTNREHIADRWQQPY